MKISYGWLKEYINVDLEPIDVAKLLTDTGLEVEGMEQIESVKGGLKGIVIGEVVEKIQHPNADRLSVTKVNIGQEQLLQIVCGAPNIDKGQKVAVATIGAVLYSGHESFKIKKGKIRGEASEGMICAEDEIGLGNSHEGIMVLDSNAKVGTKASKYFNLESDFVFEIGLTPNRSDAMSHIGVARDLRAALNQNGDTHSLNIPKISKLENLQKGNGFSVEIEDHDLCPRYAGVCLNNIKVEPSPEWLKKRLESIGLSPINNVVDITNFILHETGQPLHAFDLEKIKGNKIIVRNLEQNTRFTTLDEVERKLSNEDLIICDGESKPMCLAGVFGGLQSGVSNKTTSIFLESAYFNPVSVRKTSKRHNLNTDASFRFERGVDPNNVVYPIQRAVDLIVEICGAHVSSNLIDIYPKKIKEATLNLNLAKVTKLIGQEIPKDNVCTILKDLDIKVLEKKDDLLTISIPTYRTDVARQEDVVEEILRIYGYNNIAIPSQVLSSVSSINKPNAEKIQNTISDFLSSNGFNECINNSLTKSTYIDLIEEIDKKEQVVLLNPLSQDLNAMRQSMIFGGLENISFNLNRKSSDLKIYEFGKTYSLLDGNKFKEDRKLSLFSCGNESIESWNSSNKKKDYFWIKKQVEHVLVRLGILHFKSENIEVSSLIDGFCYKIGRDIIATIGIIHPKVTSHFSIKKEVFYGELNWDFILRSCKNAKTNFKSISKFPSVKRDLALLIDENLPFSILENIAKETEKKYLKEIQLFDVYKGDKLEKGKKSYALSFLLEDQEKTLTDKQIDKVMKNLMEAFKQKAGAEVRM
jgi:phenylalanyl-tRNA synthetase beta chain